MEIRGVKVKKVKNLTKNPGFFVLRPPEYFSVPLLTDDGDQSIRAVNVNEKVKEGSLIGKPSGRYGSYVYSPCSGKVVSVVRKLNVSGNECEHVVIARDMSDEKEYFRPIGELERDQESLLKRLYESGMVDNFSPFDPSYKKYLLKCKIKSLIINCTEDDPYLTAGSALLSTYPSEIIEGAKLLKTVANAENLVFIFTSKQKAVYKIIYNLLKKQNLQKQIRLKIYPDVYPLHDSRLIGYYETGKMVPEGSRTAETSVIVDSVENCYDFFNAVTKGMPSTQKAVSVAGNNCLRKANYFIKNGTSIEHILEIVGTKSEYEENMLIYGGIMSGIAQETLDISATLTASSILFVDSDEYTKDAETACINCGRCVACCPVRLHVKNLDDAIIDRNYNRAKKLGIEACIGCGACSYVCPAKRYLAQRISFAKDIVLGRRGKRPDSSEYVLVEGEDIRKTRGLAPDNLVEVSKDSSREVSEVEKMLYELSVKSKDEAMQSNVKNASGGNKNEQ